MNAGTTGLKVPDQKVQDWSERDSGLVETGVASGSLVREPSRWGLLVQESILTWLVFPEIQGPAQTESWTDEGVSAVGTLEGVSWVLGKL